MATSRSLLFSVALSGLVFSATVIPFAILSSRPLTVEIEDKPLITGRVQDLASPYLAAILGLSAGVGLLTLSVSEWRSTARKLNQTRDRLSALEHQIQQREHQIESLKFSESRLQSQGLNFFLDPAHTTLPTTAALHGSSAAEFSPVAGRPIDANSAARATETAASSVHHGGGNGAVLNVAPHHGAMHSNPQHQNSPNQGASQIEDVMVALKQLMNQVEQLKGNQGSDAIGNTMNPSINASAHI
ncbi:hypothetical protein [Leptolyngbya ohadii]|uniref:hypothetical protein n=1 Tax=Leptolyngbya ohadii TaxID=1962290 RepID=UPI000B59BAEE|nr:hypothetical protein [Leptolyngbya ohadii]